MAMSAVARSYSLGPGVDPGDEGWDAMGLGVHPGPGLSVLGDYSLDQRNQMLQSQNTAAGVDPATLAATSAANQIALQNANSYWAGLESGTTPAGNEQQMLAAMNPWQKAAWTGSGDPGNYIRVGNTLETKDNNSNVAGAPNAFNTPELSLSDFYALGNRPYTPPGSGSTTGTTSGTGAGATSQIATRTPLGAVPPAAIPPSTPGTGSQTGNAGGSRAPLHATTPTPVVTPTLAGDTQNFTAPSPTVINNPTGQGTGGQAAPVPSGGPYPTGQTSTTGQTMPTSAGPTTMSGTGDIVGSSANYWDPAYGGVPVVPDPVSSQYQALQGNISNLGSIYNLAGSVNQFGAQQARGQYEANLPGYDAMTGQASQDILAELEGQVPQDVINNLQQSAAERGVATSGGAGPNAGAQYLKALGITSLGQEQQGQQNLTAAIQRTPTSPLFNVASTLVSPNDEQAARMAANLYAAAPNPRAAAEEAMANAEKALAARGGGGGGGGVNLSGLVPPSSTFPPSSSAATSPYSSPIYGGTGGTTTGGNTLAGNPYTNWQNWFNGLTTGTGTGAGSSTYDLYGLGGGGGSVDPNTGLPYSVEGPSGTGGSAPAGTTGSNQWWSDPNFDPFAAMGDPYANSGLLVDDSGTYYDPSMGF